MVADLFKDSRPGTGSSTSILPHRSDPGLLRRAVDHMRAQNIDRSSKDNYRR